MYHHINRICNISIVGSVAIHTIFADHQNCSKIILYSYTGHFYCNFVFHKLQLCFDVNHTLLMHTTIYTTYKRNQYYLQLKTFIMAAVKPETFLEYIIIEYRWLLVITALMPLSFLWKIWATVRNYVVFKMNSAPKAHERKVRDVQRQVWMQIVVLFKFRLPTLFFFLLISFFMWRAEWIDTHFLLFLYFY